MSLPLTGCAGDLAACPSRPAAGYRFFSENVGAHFADLVLRGGFSSTCRRLLLADLSFSYDSAQLLRDAWQLAGQATSTTTCPIGQETV